MADDYWCCNRFFFQKILGEENGVNQRTEQSEGNEGRKGVSACAVTKEFFCEAVLLLVVEIRNSMVTRQVSLVI